MKKHQLKFAAWAICAAGFLSFGYAAAHAWAQTQTPAVDNGPQISVDGQTYTQRQLLEHDVGSYGDQTTPFMPYKVIGNIYYVGTVSLASFLVVMPQGDILIDSGSERNLPYLQQSVKQLGFKFSDIKIVLGNDARPEQMEADASVKQQTGAQVMAMAADVPALQNIKPGGKTHPIDRILHDGDAVTLGGTTLIAHLTPGYTEGTTTWTLKAQDGGKDYDVVIFGDLAVDPGTILVANALDPQIAEEYTHGFQTARSLPCEVPLGPYAGMFDMKDKVAKMRPGAPDPFIDPAGCKAGLDVEEAMFQAVLAQQHADATAAASGGATPAPAAANSSAPAAGGGNAAGSAALVTQGRDRYKAYGCPDCHGPNGEGTNDAPDLIGTHLNAQEIAAFLNKPDADALGKGMPIIAPDNPDLAPLVAFVLSIKKTQ